MSAYTQNVSRTSLRRTIRDIAQHKTMLGISTSFNRSALSSHTLRHMSSLGRGQRLTVRVERLSNRSIEFDLIGVDASIANAFRRILIAEVRPPTVLCRRVGLMGAGTYGIHRTRVRMVQHQRHRRRSPRSPLGTRPPQRRPYFSGLERP